MKDVKLKSMKFKAVDDASAAFSFQGYLSTYGNTDRDGDVIDKGAFDTYVQANPTVPMLYGHDYNQVIGKLALTIDDKGLVATGSFNEEDPLAIKIEQLIKMGALTAMSVGMAVKDYEPFDKEQPFGGWEIKSAEVYEGSIVPVPANPEAQIVSAKSADQVSQLSKQIAEMQLEIKRNQVLSHFKN